MLELWRWEGVDERIEDWGGGMKGMEEMDLRGEGCRLIH